MRIFLNHKEFESILLPSKFISHNIMSYAIDYRESQGVVQSYTVDLCFFKKILVESDSLLVVRGLFN